MSFLLWSGLDEDLQRLAGGHGAVAVGDFIQANGAVEDAAALDRALQDSGSNSSMWARAGLRRR